MLKVLDEVVLFKAIKKETIRDLFFRFTHVVWMHGARLIKLADPTNIYD